MKKYLVAVVSVLLLGFISCANGNSNPGAGAGDGSNPTSTEIKINNEVVANTKIIPVMTTESMDVTEKVTGTGPFSNASVSNPITVKNFMVGQYEVTKELWYKVCQYGNNHGYTLPNVEEPNDTEKNYAACGINFNTTKVWLNAISELSGLEPYYYSDTECTVVLKEESNDAYEKKDSKGYRLPTDLEYEFAARGGNPEKLEWTYDYSGSNNIKDVACSVESWYNATGKTWYVYPKSIGTKYDNYLNLFDMTGNAGEYDNEANTRGLYYKSVDSNMPAGAKIGSSGAISSVTKTIITGSYGHNYKDYTGLRLYRSL